MPYDLDRFVANQDSDYETVLGELRRGRKASHWIWYIFPQIAGLGRSSMSQHYAISSLDEAVPTSRIPCSGHGSASAPG